MAFKNTQSFIQFLEKNKELKRIKVPVSSELEITEIACRAIKEKAPALLFENVQNSSFPLLINPFGSSKRIEWALGRTPQEIGNQFKNFAEDIMPPSLRALWKHRRLLKNILKMKPSFPGTVPVKQISEAPNLDKIPVLKCWPEDGGRFITFPLVITKNPLNGHRNLGTYRMHVYSQSKTGMHWQIEKGGGFHYHEAEKMGKPFPVAVALGGDPITMISSILPLPEDIDEMAFAGFLRGTPTSLCRLSNGLEVPAQADFILEGHILPHERKTEGPFGDHFGHYSHAAEFPIFNIDRMHRREGAIYTAAVVGKPPQEDKYLGNAVQEMLLPLLKVMHPEIIDLWSYYETGFHNLSVVSVKQRYAKESLKSAFALLGEGQMSLSKCLILVDPGVNVRNFSEVLRAIRENFDPKKDFLLFPGTSQDTLDFTSYTMNLGSKMILDATTFQKKAKVFPPRGVDLTSYPDVIEHNLLEETLLIVKVKKEGRKTLEKMVKDERFLGIKLIITVSKDIPLEDPVLRLWGIFTRFDCARDFVPSKATFRGGWPQYEGPLGFDATWKEGYPAPLEMSPEIVERVDRRWNEYGIN